MACIQRGLLEGIRILDWTAWQNGPVATSMLGDLGADVIKIEHPVTGEPGRGVMGIGTTTVTGLRGNRNYYFEANNRSKRGITLDLKQEEGRQILYRLVEKSDVFVENWRKGTASRLGVGYDTLAKYNPRLIFASSCVFGSDGPESEKPGYDYTAQARSGLMTSVGEPGMPPMYTLGIADQMGGIMLAYAILAALVVRERTGLGQEVETSLLASLMMLQGLNVMAKCILDREFNKHCRDKAGNPLWNHYRCADDKWIALAMPTSNRYWPDFCKAMGIQKLQKDPRFEDEFKRLDNNQELIRILDELFATRPSAEWIRILEEGGELIYSIVNSVSDLLDDPQVLANNYIVDFDHPVFGLIKEVGFPIKFSKTPVRITREAPEFGQHTEEVLMEILEYDWEELGGLRERGVI